MKNFILLFFSAALVISSFAQKTSAEKKFSFKVDGSVRNYNSKYIYLHHKWNDKDFTDSAKVTNGKFVFNLKSAEPNMYWFTATQNINEQFNFAFFADPGTLTATLIGDSLPYSKVQGGQSQNDYLEYRMMINNLVML